MPSPNDPTKDHPENGDITLSDADLAQAFKDLQRGEKTAQMLESNLSTLEKKIDDLLASFEAQESARTKAEEGTNGKSEEAESDHKQS